MAEQWQNEESGQQRGGSSSEGSSSRGNDSGQSSSGSSRSQGAMIWQNRLQKMHKEAERNLADGALTAGYQADPGEIVDLLIRAQASEWSSFLQYWHHAFMASDIHSAELKEIFKAHAEDEYEHARFFGERIQQLGGIPCDKPSDIARLTPTPTEYNHDLRSMMEADLIGERETIDFYDEIIRTCGFADNVTRKIFEHVIEEEAKHADDFATLLYAYDASTGKQIETMHEEIEHIAKSVGREQARRTA